MLYELSITLAFTHILVSVVTDTYWLPGFMWPIPDCSLSAVQNAATTGAHSCLEKEQLVPTTAETRTRYASNVTAKRHQGGHFILMCCINNDVDVLHERISVMMCSYIRNCSIAWWLNEPGINSNSVSVCHQLLTLSTQLSKNQRTISQRDASIPACIRLL